MSDKTDRQSTYYEVTEMLENGVKDVFTSERYKEYLNFVSKFHNYSHNNTLLIMLQNPEASFVASYTDWHKKHNRHIKKGEKGIKIIAPSPYKVKVEVPVYDENKTPVVVDGKPLTEVKEIQKLGVKVVSVFDVSQTDGEPFIVPDFGNKELEADIDDYSALFEAISSTTAFDIKFDDIKGGAKGLCSYDAKTITINNGMSQAQNIKTLLDEIAYSRLHDPNKGFDRPSHDKREVQAESVAFVVANKLGLDTSEYSFDYIAGWSSNQEIKELKESLEVIQKEASAMITDIQTKYQELIKSKKQELVADSSDKRIAEIKSEIQSKEKDLRFVINEMDEHHAIHGSVYFSDFPAYDRIRHEIKALEEELVSLEAPQKEQNREVSATPDKTHKKAEPKYSKEENARIVAQIKELPIQDYAQHLGFTVQQVGTYYTLKEHDSVRIDPSKNRFVRNSTGAKGSVIDFSMEFERLDKQSAISKLAGYIGADRTLPSAQVTQIKPSTKVKADKLTLPQRADNMRNVFAYLINTRKIDPQIVSQWVHDKNLYQDTHKNCVFVTYDKNGNPEFASQRGTNTHKPFKADIEGSNYDTCHFINNNASKLVVCEAMIDLMSVQTILQAKGRDLKGYNYLSLNGSTKTHAVLNALKNSPTDTVILATDNDNAGKMARIELQQLISEYDKNIKTIEFVPQNEKDWNAELVSNVLKEQSSNQDIQPSLSDTKMSCEKMSEAHNQNLEHKTEKDLKHNQDVNLD